MRMRLGVPAFYMTLSGVKTWCLPVAVYVAYGCGYILLLEAWPSSGDCQTLCLLDFTAEDLRSHSLAVGTSRLHGRLSVDTKP